VVVCPPCRSRSSWLLNVWLIDSIVCRSGSLFRAGAQQPYPFVGQGGLELAAVVVLVADEGLTEPVGEQRTVGVEDPQQHLAFVGFGAGQCEADGQPVRAHSRYSRSPRSSGTGGAVALLGPPGKV
jgi:hypothetical protein